MKLLMVLHLGDEKQMISTFYIKHILSDSILYDTEWNGQSSEVYALTIKLMGL